VFPPMPSTCYSPVSDRSVCLLLGNFLSMCGTGLHFFLFTRWNPVRNVGALLPINRISQDLAGSCGELCVFLCTLSWQASVSSALAFHSTKASEPAAFLNSVFFFPYTSFEEDQTNGRGEESFKRAPFIWRKYKMELKRQQLSPGLAI
jgi:hypothetical protein